MSAPIHSNTEFNRTGFRKFYYFALIAYWPCYFVLSYVFDIIGNGNLFDFTLLQSLLFCLLLTGPLYLSFIFVGQLVLFLCSEKTKELPAAKYKRGLILRIAGIALPLVVFWVLVLLTI